MSRFADGTHLPRASGSTTWGPLIDRYGCAPEQLAEVEIDLRQAEFHAAAARRVTESELLAWREDLNRWAFDRQFPAPLNSVRRSTWDVELGQRLLDDVGDLPDAQHPAVWCWIATNLLPHFVVYRWGWPDLKDEKPPTGKRDWARFGGDLRNGLKLAMHRIQTYGAENALRATEQEFQSIQYRPAFGLDPRVAKLVMDTLLDCYDDPHSNYGKHGGTRSLDNDDVCIELRLVNSLRPLCFADDDAIRQIVLDVVDRLPLIRKSATSTTE